MVHSLSSWGTSASFCLRELRRGAAISSSAPESWGQCPSPAHELPCRWGAFPWIADPSRLLQGHTSNKKQIAFTWLQIFVLHLRSQTPKAPLQTQPECSDELPGQRRWLIFYFPPSGCSCVAYGKLLGDWHSLARKIYFLVVKCGVFNKLMWLKAVGISSATQLSVTWGVEMGEKMCSKEQCQHASTLKGVSGCPDR